MSFPTVDGRNPANQLIWLNIPLFIGVSKTSQVVVWDFFHQQSQARKKIRKHSGISKFSLQWVSFKLQTTAVSDYTPGHLEFWKSSYI